MLPLGGAFHKSPGLLADDWRTPPPGCHRLINVRVNEADLVSRGALCLSRRPRAAPPVLLAYNFSPVSKRALVCVMKVFLDDERSTPQGWLRAYWPDEVIALLKTGRVSDLSLDHDLGDDARGTGYDVVLWIEEAVALNAFEPPRIKVHSANSSARAKMEAGIRSIERLAQRAPFSLATSGIGAKGSPKAASENSFSN
ncbi:hypothetical protein SAMN05216359_101364 [Roseateles sp. YR242]|uniref:cyclic-phosphate processing receiver domain-containing protein n=1 Tax=Roseateles sp. YR242 TaxID=1855305 RepID=UPI0008D7F45F|nr:cyclic-phosphate processing receiver domain-containing protein [Roseateles sp. YR242]SEK30572.1 hypothetical protein SAMN05216359_101364 [Roseateles sp. YR242]